MNKNISHRIFFFFLSLSPFLGSFRRCASLLLFYFWRQFFTSRTRLFQVHYFFFVPGSTRIEYMHESPFHFLLLFFIRFYFCSKSHIIIRPLLLLVPLLRSLASLCFVCGSGSSSTTRTNGKRETKEIYREKFRFFLRLFLEFLVSSLIAHCANRCVTKLFRIFFPLSLHSVGSFVGFRRSDTESRCCFAPLLYHNFLLLYSFDISIRTKIFLFLCCYCSSWSVVCAFSEYTNSRSRRHCRRRRHRRCRGFKGG